MVSQHRYESSSSSYSPVSNLNPPLSQLDHPISDFDGQFIKRVDDDLAAVVRDAEYVRTLRQKIYGPMAKQSSPGSTPEEIREDYEVRFKDAVRRYEASSPESENTPELEQTSGDQESYSVLKSLPNSCAVGEQISSTKRSSPRNGPLTKTRKSRVAKSYIYREPIMTRSRTRQLTNHAFTYVGNYTRS